MIDEEVAATMVVCPQPERGSYYLVSMDRVWAERNRENLPGTDWISDAVTSASIE
jgi:hypothetical protein